MPFSPKKANPEWKIICNKCNDVGYVVGTKRCPTNPALNETWTEVCPYCMPTSRYGNLIEKLSLLTHKLLTYDPKLADDEWGTDGGSNLP